MSALHSLITKRNAWIASGLLVVLAIVYLSYYLPTANLKEPIQNQLEAIRIEDNVTAYSYTSPAFQKATSLSAFTRFINEYSALRNNESITFNKTEIKNGIGMVKATLMSRGGVETPVVYQLMNEKDRWKIESIVITPQGDDETTPSTQANAATTVAPTTPAATTATPAPQTTQATGTNSIFQDPNHGYTLEYPADWQYAQADNSRVVFNGKPGTDYSQTTLSIQPLTNGNTEPQSVQEVADKGEAALKQNADDIKLVEDGLLPPRSNKNENFHGKYTVYSYTVNNQAMKQLQVIYFRSPKRAQYVIDFIAPEAQFDATLPAARAMIASFTIS